ncbi:MAG TPA: DUF885 domain-containing protein [Anaerolineaceae bacterium]|nr:DUF885 domain-containing protein [Anaerolineaceae bacterium]HQH84973.1 DUF885 domain-containing protein [Anaerolineaceae bacterium]
MGSTIWIAGVVIVLLVLAGWLASLIWGKPWLVQGLFLRTFAKFVFKGPELLTMLGFLEKFGLHGHNARLSDASEAFQDKTYRFVRRDLGILRSYNRQRMPRGVQISADVMAAFLEDIVESERFRYHDYPVNQMFGIQSEMPNFMMTIHPVISKLEARNYVRRLNRFGVKFDQVLEGLRIREAKGCIPPRFVIRRVLDEMTAFIGAPARENPLYTVFAEKLGKLKNVKVADQQQILAEAAAAIENTVYPAYQKFIDYFTALEQKATEDDGVWKLPDGDAYYAYCLRSNTTTNYTPAEVHEIGLREVERIEAEMRAIFERLGYANVENPTRKLNELGKEEHFLYANTDEGRAACLGEYQHILDEMNAALDPYFAVRPKAILKVERVPEFREKTSAGAYYQMGALGGGRPGIFFANLRDMNEIHKFGMKTLSYHEGIPGHHFQISIAQELKSVPIFRRMLPFTAYAEGWALYAEKLAREIGMYRDDPYSELGCLDSELFRAVRLVVDTGIHYKRWTREQAIEYMSAHAAQEQESVISEIERYIVMPGQACAYKIGMIKILELRERTQKALGAAFDLREFHDVILKNGSLPLSILDEIVQAYIRQKTAEHSQV